LRGPGNVPAVEHDLRSRSHRLHRDSHTLARSSKGNGCRGLNRCTVGTGAVERKVDSSSGRGQRWGGPETGPCNGNAGLLARYPPAKADLLLKSEMWGTLTLS